MRDKKILIGLHKKKAVLTKSSHTFLDLVVGPQVDGCSTKEEQCPTRVKEVWQAADLRASTY